MKWLHKKSECCGCGACAQICPRECIKMEEDCEGFLYPVIDEDKCVHCGLCEKVCPVINRERRSYQEKVYAASSTDEALLKRSSSGGMFGMLAQYALQRNGVVFGCSYNENMELQHFSAECEADCLPFHGSKYIQSNTGNTFQECKQFLEEGRYVLYVGTPCQIAGLKSYLQKDYEKLLAVEVICHGAPSPGLWRQYITEIEEQKGKRIQNVAFRFQDMGWKTFRFKIDYADGEVEVSNGWQNEFMLAFLKNLSLRPSCYKCRSRIDYARGDIMIGDFWGINNYYKDINGQLGVSAVITLSDKGEEVFQVIKQNADSFESDLSKVIPANGCVRVSVFPKRNRERFFKNYALKKPIFLNLKKYIPNYEWFDNRYSIGVWGSYNTRLIALFLISDSACRRTFHYSNSSIVSQMSTPCKVQCELQMGNEYRKAALIADYEKALYKNFDKITEETDYVLVDLLEERFSLFECEETFITDSDALQDSGMIPAGSKMSMQEAFECGLWVEKVRQFCGMLKGKFDASHIILTELYLCEYYLKNGQEYAFDNAAEIKNTNCLLQKLYRTFEECCPGINVVKVPDKLLYTDYEHRYGCYPEHLNYDAYFAIADQIYEIMVK